MYLLIFPFLFLFSCFMQGFFTWTIPILFFIFHWDVKNKADYMVEKKESDQLILMLSPFLSWVLLIIGLVVSQSLSIWEFIGLAIGLGIVQINYPTVSSHDFFHSKDSLKRFVGILSLLSTAYPEFFLYHTKIHHKYAGTANDPSTPFFKENFYKYFLRSSVGNFKILLYSKYYKLFLSLIVLKLLVFVFVFSIFGLSGLWFYSSTIFMSRIMSSLANYIQHYGLKKVESDSTIPYIWDNYDPASNKAVFNSGMHSHHHISHTTPFYELRRNRQSIQMPYNFTFMLTLALIPPFWFLKINPLIKDKPNLLYRS